METKPEVNVENLKTAKEEIEAICKKYSITLIPIVVHQGDKTYSSIEIATVVTDKEAAPAAETVEVVS
jgi:hypothetical protein